MLKKKQIKFSDTDKTIGTIYFALKCVSKQFPQDC